MQNYKIENGAVTFLDNRFYHDEADNVWVPSVTTILQAYPKDAHFFSWLKQVGEEADAIRDEAGRRGSIVHKLTERYDAGEEISLLTNGGNLEYKLSEWAMFERYVDFREKYPFEVLYSELTCIEDNGKFAGTIDRVIEYEGENYLLDIKTSNAIHDHYWLQLAAYHELFNQFWGYYPKKANRHLDGSVVAGPIQKRAILWLNAKTRTYGKNGAIQGPGWQLIIREEKEHKKDLDLFNATMKLWQAQNKTIKPRQSTYQITHKR